MYPQAYINYLVHFHGDRDYFECHEVLEEYWKKDNRNVRKDHWVALIQIAVSLYHHRRGNFPGARRMMGNALSLLQNEREAISKLGLNYEQLLLIVEKRLDEIVTQQPYTSLFLPIENEKLIKVCQRRCQELHLEWGTKSNMSNNFLLNKHTLRNRDDVIAERSKQKTLKNRMSN